MVFGRGRIAGEGGQAEQAARLFAAAEAAHERLGVPVARMISADYERAITHVRVDLGDAAFARAWEKGRALSIEQVATEAAASRAEEGA